MILAVALLVTSPSVRAQAPSAESASRVLVMPFVAATERPPGEWLGEGAAVMLTDVFLALGLPAMERDERMQALELLRVPSRFPLSYASVMRVGQRGSLTGRGRDLRTGEESLDGPRSHHPSGFRDHPAGNRRGRTGREPVRDL